MVARRGLCLALTALAALCADADPTPGDEPIESTGADTRLDLIRRDDPSAFDCLVELGLQDGEFYDKITDALEFPSNTAFFEARFTDGTRVEIRVHPELGGPDDARAEAERIARALGRLPGVLRPGIERVGLLGGDATAMADGGGEGIHLHRENVERRVAANRFEETLFHEAVHTTLDDVHANSLEWLTAQAADGRFLTAYARARPEREDLAETALYAYALLHHPERVPADDAARWKAQVPHRIALIADIIPKATSSPYGTVDVKPEAGVLDIPPSELAVGADAWPARCAAPWRLDAPAVLLTAAFVSVGLAAVLWTVLMLGGVSLRRRERGRKGES